MRVATYRRVSRKEQAKDTNAFTRQLFQLDKALSENGLDPKEALRFEDIQSGRKDERPGFQELLSLIRADKLDCLYIIRIDRITRDLETNARLAKLLEKSKCRIYVVLKERYLDFTNPEDWQEFVRSGVNSEFESRMLQRRVKDGMAFLRHQGHANPKVPWCYSRVESKYVLSDELTARRAVAIFEESGGNIAETIRRIDSELGKRWTSAGFIRWILNPVLCGHTPRGRIGYKGGHEWADVDYHTHSDQALISDTQQAYYRGLAGSKPATGNTKKFTYTLTGLLVCQRCGYKMSISRSFSQKQGKHYHYAYCRSRVLGLESSPCKATEKGKGKEPKGIKLDDIEQSVINALCQRAGDIADLMQSGLSGEKSRETMEVERKIMAVQSLIDSIGDPDGLLKQQIANLKARIHPENSPGDPGLREVLVIAGRQPDYWMSLPVEERKILFRRLISRILILDGQVVGIEWHRI